MPIIKKLLFRLYKHVLVDVLDVRCFSYKGKEVDSACTLCFGGLE